VKEAPDLVGRAMVPIRKDDGTQGCAVIFNHLVDTAPDRVLTFLVTPRGVASGARASVVLPPHMIDAPHGAPATLTVDGWSEQWERTANHRIDLAFLPFYRLAEPGWAWDAQEVTDGMLLGPNERLTILGDELAAIGYDGGTMPSVRPVSVERRPDGAPGVFAPRTMAPGALIVALTPAGAGEARFVVVGLVGAADPDDDHGTPRPIIPAWLIRQAAQEIFTRLATANPRS